MMDQKHVMLQHRKIFGTILCLKQFEEEPHVAVMVRGLKDSGSRCYISILLELLACSNACLSIHAHAINLKR